MPRGEKLLQLARPHIGEKYVLGALAPKNNPNWSGPWDCAEFVSWLVFQAADTLYGCDNNSGDPAKADAWTGYWNRDAKKRGSVISLDEAARTPGAAVLRVPAAQAVGHIVISDGAGGTIEAHSSKRGVITSTLANRRWDMGILVPGIEYRENPTPVTVAPPTVLVYRLKQPRMKGAGIRELQRALKAASFNPGPIDGEFGPMTQAAVVAFQLSHGMVADGEVGPRTAKALGIELEPA
ncbi:MAG: peptidoglycan-binding domain-containing protein [Terriglobales bacterium]